MRIADDLREFIAQLEAEGEAIRVGAEVDWNLEIGAITRRAIDLRAPAPLFERIAGYPPGYRVFGCPMGPSTPYLHARVAIAMGLPKDTPPLDLIEAVCQRTDQPIPPARVSDAPCKENIRLGKDVNLLDFPAPWIHSVDGGRYLATWSVCVTKDPDTGWMNWGVYRAMVHDEKTLGILLHRARQHGGYMFYNKYAARNEPMPIAIATGTDPLCTMAAASSFRFGVSEAEMVGGLRGRPVELVRCETVDLEVPATAEVVIEGFVPPHERRLEGPFGEYTGYAVHADPSPIVEVTCISHRQDPIITAANMGKPWDDGAVPSSIVTGAVALKAIREAGIPVKAAYTYAPQQSIIVAAPPVPGSALRIASTLWSGATRTDLPFLVIVDEDVDVTNIEDVWWAITTRMHPRNGIHVLDGKVANPLIAWLTPDERESNVTCGVYFDARFPHHWSAEYKRKHCTVVDFERGWPQEIQERVLERWAEYGYSAAGGRQRAAVR
jgi:phenylphosphate carboxylase alpha subunit